MVEDAVDECGLWPITRISLPQRPPARLAASPGRPSPRCGSSRTFGNDFHYRRNPQAYAGAGYAAVMVDFHGSTGYGQAFTVAIRGDWGGRPYEDLAKGLRVDPEVGRVTRREG